MAWFEQHVAGDYLVVDPTISKSSITEDGVAADFVRSYRNGTFTAG